MNTKLILLLAVTAVITALTGCASDPPLWPPSGDEFVIEDGGVILCHSPSGEREIDLDEGVERNIFNNPLNVDLHNFIKGHRGLVWRPSPFNNRAIEAIAPHVGVVERHPILKFNGENTRCITVLNSISHNLLLVDVRTQATDHLCLFNTITGEFEEIWKCKIPKTKHVRLPDGSSVLRTTPIHDFRVVFSKDDPWIMPVTPERGDKTIVFDANKKEWSHLPEKLRIDKIVGPGGNLSGYRFSPSVAVLLLRNLEDSLNTEDYRKFWSRVWDYDTKTGEMKKVALGEYRFNLLFYDWELSPDGKRTVVEAKDECFIYDLTTGIIAQAPGITRSSSGAGWSPTGRYLAYVKIRPFFCIDASGVPDVYVADIETGRNKMVQKWKQSGSDPDPYGPICWITPPVTKRVTNINYARWLISLLERGVEKEKIMYRLHEFTSQKNRIPEDAWGKWMSENEDYLAWSEKEQRLYLCAETKEAKIPFDIWKTIPEDKRAAWVTLGEEERQGLRTKAEQDFSARKDFNRRAWKAGVAPEIWVHVPEDKQEKWAELKEKERIRQVSEAKKKYLKQKASGENPPSIPES